MNWQTALGCVSYSGLLILVLLIADRKKRLLASVPHSLRFGFAGGIGLFIALIGLESARFIVPHQHMGASMGPLNAQTLTFLAGMAITSVLVVRKIAGAFIFGVLLTTLMAVPLGRLWGDASSPAVIYSGWLAMPDWSLVGRIDLSAVLKPGCWPFILILAFSCLFDSLGTCVGVSEAGNLVDQNGDPVNLDQSLKANAAGLVLSGLMGSSPTTVFIESSTGVREGGRTGLTAVTAGLLFLPLLFFSPLLSLVPSVATAPMLVLAGVFMLKPLIYVRWERFDEAAPFFMSMILMPLTHSITQGIIWGVLSWTLLKAAGGQFRRISPVLLGLNAAALWLLINLKHLGY
jgi:AGZA family xanthine/uracil permease-like MFS transporter